MNKITDTIVVPESSALAHVRDMLEAANGAVGIATRKARAAEGAMMHLVVAERDRLGIGPSDPRADAVFASIAETVGWDGFADATPHLI